MTHPPTTIQLHIRRAEAKEATQLTHLTWASKAHWGYNDEFMRAACLIMIVTEESITSNIVYVAEDEQGIAGYYELLPTDTRNKGWLESLFVTPRAIGTGCGKLLWQHLVQTAQDHHYTCFEFEADPNAEGFYLHMGAFRIGERESGIVAGRMLPLMRYDIARKQQDAV